MIPIKGIVLGGGLGSRLAPLTQEDNKHLLPVYNWRMLEIPIQTLVDAGVDEVVLVTGGKRPGAFLELLKSGRQYGLKNLFYTYQEGEGGIATALSLARPHITNSEDVVVILGDNYFEEGIGPQVSAFKLRQKFLQGASCVLRKTDTPWHFGIAEVEEEGKILSIEEKPSEPKSDLAILGCYFFDYQLWNMINQVEPSARGETEITDVLRYYNKMGLLGYSTYDGYWSDMGTFPTWMEVSQRVEERCNQK